MIEHKELLIAAVCLILDMLPCSASAPVCHTVSGFMVERLSSEPLIGASVLESHSRTGAVTNNCGFYSLSLPDGEVVLDFSCMGFGNVRHAFLLDRDTVLNVALDITSEMLSGAGIVATHSKMGVKSSQMSAVEVPVTSIKSVPALAGEVDVIKVLQLLPGVQSGSEGSAGMYVRGGSPDENLLLLDGVPLYNVNHMMGFFSVFNADAVKNVTLYKGSFPARFGSRLSSVVDVRMKDGNDSALHGTASVGLLSAKVSLEGPVVRGRTSFNISARRTYFDLLSKPIIYALTSSEGSPSSAGYNFYDLNAKITHRLSGGDRLYLTCYLGDDNVNVSMKEEMSGYSVSGSSSTGIRWSWGNLVTSLRWNHLISNKMFMNASVNYTQYRHRLGVKYDLENGDSTSVDLKYNSLINDLSANCDFEYNPDSRNELKYGAQYIFHTFKPSVTTLCYAGSETAPIDTTFGQKSMFTHEAAVYAEDDISFTRWLKMNLGMRASLYFTGKKTYVSIEPRLSARILFSDDFSFKCSYSGMSQYVHLLSSGNVSLPSDLWVSVTDNIEPMRSDQVAAGFFCSFGQFNFSVEGYYKNMQNVLEYRDGTSFISSSSWEEKVAVGRGWSYGIEVLAHKSLGKLTGWVGYTWSRSFRQFDRPGNIINFGKPFPAKYDRIHDLSMTASYPVTDRIRVSATYIYGTGTCGSLPLQTVIAGDFSSVVVPVSYVTVDFLEGRNNYRLPSTHRFDIGADFDRRFGNGHSRTINVSVYNALNCKNPFIVFKGSAATETQEGSVRSVPVLKQLSIFPILPSISYTYKF